MQNLDLGLESFFASEVVVKWQHFLLIIWIPDCASNPIAVTKLVYAVVEDLRAYITRDSRDNDKWFLLTGEKCEHPFSFFITISFLIKAANEITKL